MNQTTAPSVQQELKLQKTTIVKLNMNKVGQLVRNNLTATNTSASLAPQCDPATATLATMII